MIRLACLALALAAPSHGAAEGPAPFPEFTFKRMKPPSAGTKKRITVQIAPEPVALVKPKSTKRAEPGTADAPSDHLAWFWSSVSGNSAALRVNSALSALQKGPAGRGFPAPRLQTLREIADRHGVDILKHTMGTRISPAFALAVIAVESGGRSDALSRAGAQGLMQLMPATADRFGVRDRTVADDNIRAGVTYLNWLMNEFDGDPLLALAGYNAGENNVKKYNGVPPFAETRGYVPKVLAAWSVAKGLCLTPPQLITDGCVFVRAQRASDG
ncbi:lytic transglycosylase domain-containing protein [Oceaniglobus indicus]|uniref:lytic transglycosylase domain-containing protein n=1 Tax=Oceaniglobus indicus TaxID=2047749 RepID=UPI0030C6F22C